MRNKILIALAVLSLGFANCASGQVPVVRPTPTCPPCRLIQVVNKETPFGPIENAELIDSTSGSYMLTNTQGAANLEFISRLGSNKFYIRKLGYKLEEIVYNVTGEDSPETVVTVYLERVATTLPTATMIAKFELIRDPGMRSGIYDRCEFARVSCVLELELAKHPAANIFDFLKKADGIVSSCSGEGNLGMKIKVDGKLQGTETSRESCIAKMRPSSGTGTCIPSYFIDGQEWDSMKGSALSQLQTFLPPSRIQAIEVYRSEQPKPPRFEGKPMCGSIVIWTK